MSTASPIVCAVSRRLAVAAALVCAAAVQAGQSGSFVVPAPDFDVWVYPPGAGFYSPYAVTYASPFGDPDPDRLGYAFYGFDLAGQLPADPESYVLTELVVTVRLLNSSTFDPIDTVRYDPTPDPLSSFTGGPDTTPGRPIELYGVEYQNGYTYDTWKAVNAPVGANYNVQPVDLDPSGNPRNVLNSVDDGIEANPFAVATTTQTHMGPDGTVRISNGATLTFTVDLSRPGAEAYWREQLASGKVGVIVSSLHAAGFSGMGGEEIYPRLGTAETFGDYKATLFVAYDAPASACPGDLNGDGAVNADDLGLLLAAFGGTDAGDLNGDGLTNADDLGLLLAAFGTACQ
jgi:hypothetical protein